MTYFKTKNPPQKCKLHCCYTMKTPRGDGNIPADFGLMMGSRLLPETPAGVTENQQEDIMDNESRTDEAKARVEAELSDLNVKIVKLTTFLYGDMPLKANLSRRMIVLMKNQLETMARYAEILQDRLSIWGMTDEQLYEPRERFSV